MIGLIGREMSEKEEIRNDSDEIEIGDNSMSNGEGVAIRNSNGVNGDETSIPDDEGYATLQKPIAAAPSGLAARKKSLTLSTMDTDDRRSDEPVKLSFEKGKCSALQYVCRMVNQRPSFQFRKTEKRR